MSYEKEVKIITDKQEINKTINEKIKGRLNAMRREFKSFERAKDFMNLQHVINNFVNPHQELKEKTIS